MIILNKIKKIVGKMFLIILPFCLIILALIFITGSLQNYFVDKEVNDFINDGVFERQIDNIRYYTVDRDLQEPSLRLDSSNNPVIPTKGDIIVNRTADDFPIPFISQFLTYNFGGHAEMIIDEDKTIGWPGFGVPGGVIEYQDMFDFDYHRNTIGLRVDTTTEVRNNAVDYAIERIDYGYNYSFIFNKDKTFYCTDVVSRSYRNFDKNLNLSRYKPIVGVNDLVLSKDTSITFYSYFDDDILNIYYAV